jgi:large subunit ribosomal protein L10
MGMNREAKQVVVDDLSDRLGKAKAALVANFQGLNVAAVTDIRRMFRAAGVDYRVVKNTLMKRALAGTAREKIGTHFTGTTAVAFKYDDEIGRLGKAAQEIKKKYEKFQVKAGFVEDDVIDGEKAADALASLPTREEVRATLLGLINAPAAKLLAQINAPASNLIGVVQAKKEKDEKGAGEAAPAA